jgi:VanZ family protein
MRISARLGSLLWIGGFVVVALFSLKPNLGPPGEYHVDVALHLATYFFLAYLPFSIPIPKLGRGLMIGALALFAVGSEFLQHFMPGRTASLSDGIANVAGIGVALAIVWLIASRTHPSTSKNTGEPSENQQFS